MSPAKKTFLGIAIALSAICVSLAVLYIYTETWSQWSPGVGWVNLWTGSVHSGLFLVFGAIALLNFVLLVILGVWWAINGRNRSFPHRRLAFWLLLLLISAASYFPSDQQYAAATVLVLGPGAKSKTLQRDAALWDSRLLLDALIVRGAKIEETLLCFAAYDDSPNVVNRLIEYGAGVNDRQYPSEITALHQAVEGKRYRNAELLMRAGARADIPNHNGKTALDLAVANGDQRMIAILKR